MQHGCVFCTSLELKLLHARCCISLYSTLKVSSGVDETVLGGVELPPGNVCITCSFECEHREAPTSVAKRGQHLSAHVVYICEV